MATHHSGSLFSDVSQGITASDAPERDGAGDAPQVNESVYPEVHYQHHPPEVISANLDANGNPTNAKIDGAVSWGYPKWSARSKTQRRMIFWLIIIILIVIVAIAVGVGVGVGVGTKHGKTSSSGNSFSGGTGSSPSEISRQSMLENTVLAAVTGSNGNRHIFFQDKNNTIRQAVFRHNKWTASTTYTIANDARANSPLTALVTPLNTVLREAIIVYYIAENNSIITQAFVGGSWYNPGSRWGNSGFEAKPGSQYLAASFTPDRNASSQYASIFMLFEDKDGFPSAQLGIYNPTASSRTLEWQDVTDNLMASYGNASFTSPFATTTVDLGEEDARVAILARDANGAQADYAQLFAQLYSSNATFEEYKTLPRSSSNDVDLVGIPFDNHDFIIANVYNTSTINSATTGPYGMVVNNSKLTMFGTKYFGPRTGPETDFPFTRLATTTPMNSTIFYLYHQMNGTFIAEDSFDIAIGAWETTYIEIGTG